MDSGKQQPRKKKVIEPSRRKRKPSDGSSTTDPKRSVKRGKGVDVEKVETPEPPVKRPRRYPKAVLSPIKLSPEKLVCVNVSDAPLEDPMAVGEGLMLTRLQQFCHNPEVEKLFEQYQIERRRKNKAYIPIMKDLYRKYYIEQQRE